MSSEVWTVPSPDTPAPAPGAPSAPTGGPTAGSAYRRHAAARRLRRAGLVDRLTAVAVAATRDPAVSPERVADRLVALAGGNRAAVHRALRRLEPGLGTVPGLDPVVDREDRGAGAGSRGVAPTAAGYLRLALRRGRWNW